MPRGLTEEEIIEQLVDAGWSRHEAEDEVKRMFKEDAEEGEDELPF